MPANLENSVVPTGLEKVSFRSSPKERQCQRMFKVKKVKEVKSLSRFQLFATQWPPPSMGFSRQGYWSGLPFPSPGDPHDPGIKPKSPTLQADTLPSKPLGKPPKCSNYCTTALISHASKAMFKILQARLQQYMNCELPYVQAGLRKSKGTRDQSANICWIIWKAREFQ